MRSYDTYTDLLYKIMQPPRDNGSQAGVNALEASLKRSEEEYARLQLYKEYSTPEQSMEDFVDGMVERLGSNWVFKLSR